MMSFDNVKDFFDYLIIDDEGWAGLKEDAPESAKQAYQDYINKQRLLEKNGVKI